MPPLDQRRKCSETTIFISKINVTLFSTFEQAIRHLQHGLDQEFRTDRFIHNKLITGCQDVPAYQYACFKPSESLAGLINDIRSSIITFNKLHHTETESYLTNRRYHSRHLECKYSEDKYPGVDTPRDDHDHVIQTRSPKSIFTHTSYSIRSRKEGKMLCMQERGLLVYQSC